jgi:hypothetical protein
MELHPGTTRNGVADVLASFQDANKIGGFRGVCSHGPGRRRRGGSTGFLEVTVETRSFGRLGRRRVHAAGTGSRRRRGRARR